MGDQDELITHKMDCDDVAAVEASNKATLELEDVGRRSRTQRGLVYRQSNSRG